MIRHSYPSCIGNSSVSSSVLLYTPLLLLNATTEIPFVDISGELVPLHLYDFILNINILLSFIAC